MRILAVDDDAIALKLLKQALLQAGHEDVKTCTSGADAFEAVLEDDRGFDCFLFDIQMPGMNGIDLCQEVRAMDRYARTPVIMITGMSEKSFIDRAFAAGATDYLTKPYDPTEVGARIRMSEELTSERKYLEESSSVIEMLIKELDRATNRDIDEPIQIGNISRVLSYPAFENYLFQLSRGVFVLSCLFAVKVRDVEAIHEKLPPLEFKAFLGRAAIEVIAKLRRHEVFLSYRGNGIFVGVMQKSGANALRTMTDLLEVELFPAGAEIVPDLPDEAQLVIGDPVVPRFFSKPGSFRNLRAAIASAESKSRPRFVVEAPQDPMSYPGEERREAFRRQRIRQQHELREEYEDFLRESLGDDNAPAPIRQAGPSA